MPGGRPRGTRVGDRAEYLATFLLSRVAQSIPVPRQEDFGIDFMGALLREGASSVEIGPSFSVQIKSNVALLRQPLGRLSKAEWSEEPIKWLLGLDPYPVSPVPLFYAVANVTAGSLELFNSLGVLALRGYGKVPAEIVLVPGAESEEGQWPFYEEKIRVPRGSRRPPSGATRYVINLGHPIARLTVSDVASAKPTLRWFYDTLNAWCKVDQLNRMAAMLGIPITWIYRRWTTNQPPNPSAILPMVSASLHPGDELQNLEKTLIPLVMVLLMNYETVGDQQASDACEPLYNFLRERYASYSAKDFLPPRSHP